MRPTVVITDSSLLTGIPTGVVDTQLEPAIVLVEVQGEQAVVTIVTAIKAVPLICREQRLYHHTASGWQQAVLDEEMLAALRHYPFPWMLYATEAATGRLMGLPHQ